MRSTQNLASKAKNHENGNERRTATTHHGNTSFHYSHGEEELSPSSPSSPLSCLHLSRCDVYYRGRHTPNDEHECKCQYVCASNLLISILQFQIRPLCATCTCTCGSPSNKFRNSNPKSHKTSILTKQQQQASENENMRSNGKQ